MPSQFWQALCQRETNVLVSVDVEANPLSHSTNIQNVIAA